jgi:glycosyltransferase involved in cell wall biosynthesis
MNRLNLACPINSLSYGLVSLNLVKQLCKQKEISLYPIGNVSVENLDDKPLIQKLVNNQGNPDPEAPSLRIYHQFDLMQRLGRGKHFGFPIFELDSFNKRELSNLESCDHLISCSKWAAQILQDAGFNCSVVPLGVDRSIFFEGIGCWNSPYTFISIGKIEYRKGHDILPKLFQKALPKGGDWHLHMLWGNPFIKDEEKLQWEGYYRSVLGDNVSFCDRVATQVDIANAMRDADCGISMSRAEGWNLPLLELMSCGKPIITTNYSAHTEFCTKENANLVDINELETAEDGKWFFGQGNWAKLGPRQEEQAIEFIRKEYKRGKCKNEEGIKTACKFSWENSVQQLVEILG